MHDLILIAISSRLQNSALVLGVIGIVIGLILIKGHQTAYLRSLSEKGNNASHRFEQRKLRRRTVVAALVTSIGFMLASMYWVNDVKVLAIFTLLIVCQLVVIWGFAALDFLSLSLREMAKPDERTQREMLEEFLKTRETTNQSSNDDPQESK